MPASCHPRSCLYAGRVCWAAWVQLFPCLCFCKPCCARAVFIIHDAGELLDLSFLTKAWKWPMQFFCRLPQVQSFLQTGVVMWLLLLHHRLVQGGDSSGPRQHSVIYVTWVWFAHRTGFQRLVNCQSKSSPRSLGAHSSAVLWGFYVVLLFCLGPSCFIESPSHLVSLAESTFLLILLRCFTAVVAVITRLLHFG